MTIRLVTIFLLLSYSAACQIDIDDPKATPDDLTKALEQGGDSALVLYRRAQAYTREGDLQSALYDLEHIHTADTLMLLQTGEFKIIVYHYLGMRQEMEDAANSYFLLDPDGYKVRLILAGSYMDNRNFPAAYSQLSKVIETHPEITSAFIMRSIVLAQMGNMEAAELDLTAAEKADINLLNVPDLNQLATALNVLFKYQNAKRYADKSLSLSPTFQGYVNQGWSLWGLQQFQASIGPLTRALAIRSDFMPYLLRGKSYYMLKDYNRAESDLKNTLAIQPNQEEPYVFLGYIYQSRKNMKDACECWRKAYEIGNQADIAAEIQKFCK